MSTTRRAVEERRRGKSVRSDTPGLTSERRVGVDGMVAAKWYRVMNVGGGGGGGVWCLVLVCVRDVDLVSTINLFLMGDGDNI